MNLHMQVGIILSECSVTHIIMQVQAHAGNFNSASEKYHTWNTHTCMQIYLKMLRICKWNIQIIRFIYDSYIDVHIFALQASCSHSTNQYFLLL